jgi:hypothetical protein
MASSLSAVQRADFDRDGYVIVRGFFDRRESDLLRQAMEQDPAIAGHFYDSSDAGGAVTRMGLWGSGVRISPLRPIKLKT